MGLWANRLVLQELLRARYAPHLEGPQFNDLIVERKEILTGMVKMLESKAVDIVEYSEPGPKVTAELVSLQGEIFPRPTKVIELPLETLINLSTKPTLELVPSLAVMRASVFLRSTDVYDPLHICLQETGSQEISALICESVFSGVELTCHATCILLELSSIATCLSQKPVPLPPP